VNQRLPSLPVTIPRGTLVPKVPGANSVITPVGVTLPIARALSPSANQRLPSGPAVMPSGVPLAERPLVNSVIGPTTESVTGLGALALPATFVAVTTTRIVSARSAVTAV